MRFAIFGSGGAGGYFGAQLARAGEDVVFIARGEHLRAIRTQGLRVETPKGEIVIQPAQATDDPVRAGPADVVLVGVKAWQVEETAHALSPLIGPDTIVVPLQNGVEAPAQLAAVLGPEHVLGGTCGTLSQVTGPGRIRSIGEVHFVKFGELDNRASERVERLRQIFARAGVKAEVPADIHQAIWGKFLLVASFGGVGAVTRAPLGVVRTVPEARRMLGRCMHEVHAVARARGVALADALVADTLAFLDSMPAAATTSLQRDIADGKPSELEAWTGAVVRLGREAGVATPLHEFIYHSLLPSEQRARGQIRFPA
ncbi:MAG TPA: 2-dehydropantoate 2-reductase [Burkholderiales bacterium]|nr:2-dehydropantoate 2-reductase [Burkholderiales bacterium]